MDWDIKKLGSAFAQIHHYKFFLKSTFFWIILRWNLLSYPFIWMENNSVLCQKEFSLHINSVNHIKQIHILTENFIFIVVSNIKGIQHFYFFPPTFFLFGPNFTSLGLQILAQ